MNIYQLLRTGPINDVPTGHALTFVIVATNEAEARNLAVARSLDGDESVIWRRDTRTRCQMLGVESGWESEHCWVVAVTRQAVDGIPVPATVAAGENRG